MRSKASKGSSQAGTVLVLFAMIAFVLMGMAALCVDMGFVVLTRTEMQSAADTAALEGLRMRDLLPNEPPEVREEVRREEARQLAALMFDEDGILPGEDLEPDARLYGAGPVFDLSGGYTSANASQLLGENSYLYLPDLQLNLGNDPSGDMASGEFLEDPYRMPVEDSAYRRSDFIPEPGSPAGSPDRPRAGAFLVRLRRTNDFQGLDNLPGVSSAGPALPFLFGLGTVMRGGAPGSPMQYQPRIHGLTVRATAIADARRALSVGRPVTVDSPQRPQRFLGVTPFVIWNQFWKKYNNVLANGYPLLINERGKVKVFDDRPADPRPDPRVMGGSEGVADHGGKTLGVHVSVNERKVAAYFPPEPYPTSVGERLIRYSVPFRSDGPFTFVGLAPVVRPFNREDGFREDEPQGRHPGYVRVVGFVLVQLKGEKVPGRVTLRKFTNVVVPHNASAAYADGLEGLRKKQVVSIMRANARIEDPALAPALVK